MVFSIQKSGPKISGKAKADAPSRVKVVAANFSNDTGGKIIDVAETPLVYSHHLSDPENDRHSGCQVPQDNAKDIAQTSTEEDAITSSSSDSAFEALGYSIVEPEEKTSHGNKHGTMHHSKELSLEMKSQQNAGKGVLEEKNCDAKLANADSQSNDTDRDTDKQFECALHAPALDELGCDFADPVSDIQDQEPRVSLPMNLVGSSRVSIEEIAPTIGICVNDEKENNTKLLTEQEETGFEEGEDLHVNAIVFQRYNTLEEEQKHLFPERSDEMNSPQVSPHSVINDEDRETRQKSHPHCHTVFKSMSARHKNKERSRKLASLMESDTEEDSAYKQVMKAAPKRVGQSLKRSKAKKWNSAEAEVSARNSEQIQLPFKKFKFTKSLKQTAPRDSTAAGVNTVKDPCILDDNLQENNEAHGHKISSGRNSLFHRSSDCERQSVQNKTTTDTAASNVSPVKKYNTKSKPQESATTVTEDCWLSVSEPPDSSVFNPSQNKLAQENRRKSYRESRLMSIDLAQQYQSTSDDTKDTLDKPNDKDDLFDGCIIQETLSVMPDLVIVKVEDDRMEAIRQAR